MKNLFAGLTVLACMVGMNSCKEDTVVEEVLVPTPTPIEFDESEPHTPDYCRAVVNYHGCYDGESDLYILNLYTTTQKTEEGEATGDYEMLQLAVFAPLNYEETVDEEGQPLYVSKVSLDSLMGTYNVPDAMWGAYSFLPGMMVSKDSPKGYVEVPERTLYATYAGGEMQGNPDLLSEGAFTLAKLDNGQYSIEGVLVGTTFAKHYFSYKGALEVEIADQTSPNTNLKENLALPQFTQGCVVDYGDTYHLGDESYRQFVVYLATSGMELREDYPVGNGELLALDLFVPWQATAAAGIPEGTYSMTPMLPNGGIYRKDIVPYRIVPGTPNRYTFYSGSWYRQTVNGELVNYARLTDGMMEVKRNPMGGYEIRFELKDAKAHTIAGIWMSNEPLQTFGHEDNPIPDTPIEDEERPAVTTNDSILYRTQALSEETTSPVRATFVEEADGMVSLYLTPGDITYASELETAFYYCRLSFDPAEADGSVVRIENQSDRKFEIEAVDNYSEKTDATSSSSLNGATGRYKVRRTSDGGPYYELFIDVTFANGNNLYASYSGIFKDFAEQAPEDPNQFVYNGETYELRSAIIDQRDDANNRIFLCGKSGVTTLEEMAQSNPVCITIPASAVGDMVGFSSCPSASMSYDGNSWSGSNKMDSGTIETHLNGSSLFVSFNNWLNFSGKYQGPVTVFK